MNINNKVSIITPVYNSENYLRECIDSVLSQTYKDFEHILVDDCSNDNSATIITDYALKDNRIKYIKLKKNSGAGVARNKAIERATGRYIAFLDSDDFWESCKLEKQLNFMRSNNYQFVYSQYYVIKENVPHYIVQSPSRVDFSKMLKNDYIGCLTAIYDVQEIGKIFMPDIRKRQDWVLWLRILKKVDYAYGLQEPLAYYRTGNSSLSNGKIGLLKHNFNVYHKELNMTYFKSIFMMIQFLCYYFSYKVISKKKYNY